MNYAELEGQLLDWVSHGAPQFDAMAMLVFDFQQKANAAYARYCSERPQPRNWREIPAVPVEAFRTTPVRSFQPDATLRTFRTSGTTGEGFGEHHFCSLSLYREASVRGWEHAGLSRRSVVAVMRQAEEAPFSSLSQMAAWLTSPERFCLGDWDRLVHLAGALEKPVLFGTAIAFLAFSSWMAERHLRLPDGISLVETGGYKATGISMTRETLYRDLEDKLGVPERQIWNEYGMTELTSQFYSRGARGRHCGPPWVRAMVVRQDGDDEVEDGETGCLQIVDPLNLGSVLAVRTRDLAVRRGSEFELIGRDPAALPRGCSRAVAEYL